MGQPVVLPKFELPGDKPHWAVRAAWITGGLLLISVLALGGVIVHHRNLETQAHLAKAEAIARVKAEADAKVAAIAAAAKAQKEAELAAARAAAQRIPATTLPSTGAGVGATDGSSGAHAARTSQARRTHAARSKSSKVGKSSARADKSDKSDARSAAKKDDAIDELLRKMK